MAGKLGRQRSDRRAVPGLYRLWLRWWGRRAAFQCGASDDGIRSGRSSSQRAGSDLGESRRAIGRPISGFGPILCCERQRKLSGSHVACAACDASSRGDIWRNILLIFLLQRSVSLLYQIATLNVCVCHSIALCMCDMLAIILCDVSLFGLK